MGEVLIDQFWMPVGGLYGRRKQRSPNHAVIDYFWTLCGKYGAVLHEDVQQS